MKWRVEKEKYTTNFNMVEKLFLFFEIINRIPESDQNFLLQENIVYSKLKNYWLLKLSKYLRPFDLHSISC